MNKSILEQARDLHEALMNEGYSHVRLCQIVTGDDYSPTNYQFVAVKTGDNPECFENAQLISLDSPMAAQILLSCVLPESILFYEYDNLPFNSKNIHYGKK
jgi:hypothetical protein